MMQSCFQLPDDVDCFPGEFGPEPGLVRTSTGRQLYWTGRVAIGLRANESAQAPREHTPYGVRMPDPGVNMERLQTALLGMRTARRPKRVQLTREDWIDIGHKVVGVIGVVIMLAVAVLLTIERMRMVQP